MQRRLRPDWSMFAALGLFAVLLFVRVGPIPDYDAGRTQAPLEASTVSSRTGELPVQDFAYIFNYARHAVARRATSPYSVDEHRQFLTAWLGPHISSTNSFPYSPIMVFLLAPLFPLPTAWAWLVWNLASAWIGTLGIRSTVGTDRWLLLLRRNALVSPTIVDCFALGQTALLTTGLLGLMVLCAPGASVGAAVCLFLLTIKPPLAAVGATALLAAGCGGALLIAGAACAAVLIGAIAWWNVALVHDYLALVGHYDLVNAPMLFREGLHPENMTNLRNALLHTGWVDDAQASRVTVVSLMVALAFPVLHAARTRRAVPIELAAAWAAMGYLLFSPHLSHTEDFLLVMVWLWLRDFCDRRTHDVLAGLCIGVQIVGVSTVAMLTQLGTLASIGPTPLIVFVTKVVVAAMVVRSFLVARRVPAVAIPT